MPTETSLPAPFTEELIYPGLHSDTYRRITPHHLLPDSKDLASYQVIKKYKDIDHYQHDVETYKRFSSNVNHLNIRFVFGTDDMEFDVASLSISMPDFIHEGYKDIKTAIVEADPAQRDRMLIRAIFATGELMGEFEIARVYPGDFFESGKGVMVNSESIVSRLPRMQIHCYDVGLFEMADETFDEAKLRESMHGLFFGAPANNYSGGLLSLFPNMQIHPENLSITTTSDDLKAIGITEWLTELLRDPSKFKFLLNTQKQYWNQHELRLSQSQEKAAVVSQDEIIRALLQVKMLDRQDKLALANMLRISLADLQALLKPYLKPSDIKKGD